MIEPNLMTLPWQRPNATEAHAAWQLHRQAPHLCENYLAYPWATWIDRLRRGFPVPPLPESSNLRQLTSPLATVCQHISALSHSDIFEEAGITDLFWSHATLGLTHFKGLRIHPFPLYPVRCVSHPPTEPPLACADRPFLYSFQGAYKAGNYLTQVRDWILQLPARPDAVVEQRREWHYEQEVYREQVRGLSSDSEQKARLQAEADSYVRTLQQSCFALCPSGSGPNSIRIWEALGYGAIPVILADSLYLPGDPEIWRQAALQIPEDRATIATLPQRLQRIRADHGRLESMQAAGKKLWGMYGQDSFTTDVQRFLGNPNKILIDAACKHFQCKPHVLVATDPATLPIEVSRQKQRLASQQPLLIQINDCSASKICQIRWQGAIALAARRIGAGAYGVCSLCPRLEKLQPAHQLSLTEVFVNPAPTQKHTGWNNSMVNESAFIHAKQTFHDGWIFFAFLASSQHICLAARSPSHPEWQIRKTPFRPAIEGQHPRISIVVDATGIVHIAWNASHDTLGYAKSRAAYSVEEMNELPVTRCFPKKACHFDFLLLKSGNLLLLYCQDDGAVGELSACHYSAHAQEWTGLQHQLLSGLGGCSPRWQACVGPNDTIHLSWSWHNSLDAGHRYSMYYAQSHDEGASWMTSSGEFYALPISYQSAEMALPISTQASLSSEPSAMCADAAGNPYICTSFDDASHGQPQYQLIFKQRGQWVTEHISHRMASLHVGDSSSHRLIISRPLLACVDKGERRWLVVIGQDAAHKSSFVVYTHDDCIATKERALLAGDELFAYEWDESFFTELRLDECRTQPRMQRAQRPDETILSVQDAPDALVLELSLFLSFNST